MEIVRQQPLQNFNTLNIPASANYFGVVRQASDLATLIAMPEYRSASKTVLGGGSNIVLLNDLPGFVLLNQIKARMVADETEDYLDLRVGGGENWHELVHYCVENGWGGIENLALIPGTAGAAPVQNIGAYGVELKDVLISVECVELNSGQSVSFNNADCEFGYRDSVFKNRYKNRYLISSILIRLQKKPQLKLGYGEINQQLQQKNISQPTLRDVFDAVCAIRQRKLPDPAQLPNAGSFFKNPLVSVEQYQRMAVLYPAMPHYPAADQQVKLAAGWLIEQAGWKGKGIGPVRMYEKQALVLVNAGGDGSDVLQLAQRVQQSVYTQFQVTLEIEPELLPPK